MNGKNIRLKQLFKNSSRTFILPMDHGITIGPDGGLKDIIPIIDMVKEKVDAVVVHKGLVKQIGSFFESKGPELVVHLSGSTILSPKPDRKELLTSVEHAIMLGATAVSVHVNLGNDSEISMLKDLGRTSEVCNSWGMPLIAMMYVRDGTKSSEYDAVKIKHAARVAEELGADIVKVNYTGTVESFKEVVTSVKIPVIIAGGPKTSSDAEVLTLVKDAIGAGGKGVAIGRNVFQHSNPKDLADEIFKIVHSV